MNWQTVSTRWSRPWLPVVRKRKSRSLAGEDQTAPGNRGASTWCASRWRRWGHLAAGMADGVGRPRSRSRLSEHPKDDFSGEARDLMERSLAIETARIYCLVRELVEHLQLRSAVAVRIFCPVTPLRETVDMLCHQGQLDGVEVKDLSARRMNAGRHGPRTFDAGLDQSATERP